MAAPYLISLDISSMQKLTALYRNAVNKFKQISANPSKMIEVETRIGVPGKYNNGKWDFNSSIDKDFFYRVKTSLDSLSKPSETFTITVNRQDPKSFDKMYRKIESDGKIYYQLKTKIDNVTSLFLSSDLNQPFVTEDRNVHMLRVAFAEEETEHIDGPIKAKFLSLDKSTEVIRQRQRFEYNIVDSLNGSIVKIELTVVDSNKYEIESEYLHSVFETFDVAKIDNLKYLFTEKFFPPLKVLMRILFPSMKSLYGLNEIESRYRELLLASAGGTEKTPLRPKNIAESDVPVLTSGYSWTNKLNGVFKRMLITTIEMTQKPISVAVCVSNADVRFLAIDPNDFQLVLKQPVTTTPILKNYLDTLIDTEYFVWKKAGPHSLIKEQQLHIFDCLVFKNKSVTLQSHDERINIIQTTPFVFAMNKLLNPLNTLVEIKEFFYSGPNQLVKDLTDTVRYMFGKYGNSIELSNDGVIMTPVGTYTMNVFKDTDPKSSGKTVVRNKSYYDRNFPIFKWKFPDLVSIDFYAMQISADNHQKVMELYSSDGSSRNLKDNLVKFVSFNRGHSYNVPTSLVVGDDNPFFSELKTGSIVEVAYNRSERAFKLLRIRDDKTEPNAKNTAELTFVDMYKEFSLPQLIDLIKGGVSQPFAPREQKGSHCLEAYRKLHNKIKGMMINKYANKKRVLDLGAGKGGDLFKYENAHITKLWAVEPNNEYINNSTNGLKERLTQFPTLKRITTIINTGAQDTRTISDEMMAHTPSMANVVVSFFSMSFFFDNENTLNGVVDTIAKNLESKGLFFGTMMDGERVYMEMKGKDKLVGVDNCWTISRKYPVSAPLGFGLEIGVNLSDTATVKGEQIEWLSPFEMLVNKLAKYNIVLKDSAYFNTVVSTNKDMKTLYAQLSPGDKLLNSMYRTFVFEKQAPVSSLSKIVSERQIQRELEIDENSLESLETDEIESDMYVNKNIYSGELCRTGVIGEGSCFFHSLLYNMITTSYNAMNERERRRLIKKVREAFSEIITLPVLESLGSGDLLLELGFQTYIKEEFSKSFLGGDDSLTSDELDTILATAALLPSVVEQKTMLINQLVNQGYDKEEINDVIISAELRILDKYRRGLKDCSAWVEFNNIEYVMRILNYNVFIITDSDRLPKRIANCSLYNPKNPSVIILNLEGKNNKTAPHFEPISEIIENRQKEQIQTTIFDWNHPLIKSLYDYLCNV